MNKFRIFLAFLVITNLGLEVMTSEYSWRNSEPTYTSSESSTYSTEPGTSISYTYSSSPTYTSSSGTDSSSRWRSRTSSNTSGSTSGNRNRSGSSLSTSTTTRRNIGTGGSSSSGWRTRSRTTTTPPTPVTSPSSDNAEDNYNPTTPYNSYSSSDITSSSSSSTSSNTNSSGGNAPSNAPNTPTNTTISSTLSFIDILQSTQYGPYLANGDMMSLYINIKDGPGNVNCYDECARRFIPASIKLGDSMRINQNLDDNLVASIARADGVNQVTYNRYPLYLFSGDKDPGQTTGQGVDNTWYLINDKGRPISNNTQYDTIPTDNANNNNYSPALGPESIGLTISTSTSMLVVPDTFLLYFTIISKNPDFATGAAEIEKKSKDFVAIIRKLNTMISSDLSKVSLADKKIFFDKTNSFFSYTFFTTTTDPDIIDKINLVVNRLNQKKYNIFFSEEYTMSDKLLKSVKTHLYGMAVKTAMENAVDMTEKLRFEINKNRPINSISVDTSSMQSYYPLFFRDTSSFYFLNKNKGVNVVTLKSSINFNIKKK